MNSAKYEPTIAGVANWSASGWTPAKKSYRFRVLLTKEDDGTFSAVALNLPGVTSAGDTVDEALANFHDAATLALESYAESGDAIPWKNTYGTAIPHCAEEKWIIVDG